MAKPRINNPFPDFVVLDTDVIVNWLTQEIETGTGKLLWKAPYEIFESIEHHQLKGSTGLTNILELRFLLRRKKNVNDQIAEETITLLGNLINIIIPDEITLLRANLLQAENHLDPFDSIIMAIALGVQSAIFLSRDNSLLKIASHKIPAVTPEEFISNFKATTDHSVPPPP